ncbi:MAG: fibronectin type III domain-containing protein [Lachnospiraceae bacterium]|nr:fibronectin type III domain-containing protein [Lachnospiraceae bacterium]
MKILHKVLAVLLCLLIPLSNTSMAFAMEIVFNGNRNTAQEISAKNREIKLNAGKGSVDSESVILEDGKTLPEQLPEAVCAGWTFEGWYTAEVTENYWGDQEGETFSALLANCGGNREAAVEKDFSWIVESEGTLVKAGEELPANVGTLYAMYKPTNNITIRWHYNGWKKNTGVFLTHTKKEYGSPVVLAELESFLAWENHEFAGWYTAAGKEWKFDKAVTDRDNGKVYYISNDVVTEDLDLYAHWTGRVEPDTIRLSQKSGLVEPGETVSITASYSPLSADAPELEWAVSGDANVVKSQKVSEDGLTITLVIDENADAIQSNKYVTVTARSQTNAALSGKADITIGHSWKLASYEDSSCNKSGVKHYQCSKHERAKKDVAVNPDGHRFVKSDRITKEPTCVAEGSYTDIYTCYVCHATEQVITKIPATGIHVWDGGKITVSPTCAEAGTMTYACTGCDLTKEETIPATGQHTYEKTSTVVNKEADCGNDGLHTDTYTCTVCQAEKTEQVTDPATGEHDFYKFVTLNLGKRNYYQSCRVCGKTEFLYTEETEWEDGIIILPGLDFPRDEDVQEPFVTIPNDSTEREVVQDSRADDGSNVNADGGIVTIPASPKGDSAGTEIKPSPINKADNSITASDVSTTYSTKVQSFPVEATSLGNAKLTYTSDNKSVTIDNSGRVTVKEKFMGKATITIHSASTARYNSSSKKIDVTVNPSKPALASVKNTKGSSISAKWKKTAAVTGYQLQYSTDRKFRSKVKTASAAKGRTVSKTVRSLKKGKTYSVRVRAYKTVAGTKYYSEWSNVKKVAINK